MYYRIDDEVEEPDAADAAPPPAKQRAARKPPKAPDIVDIEMYGDVSFESFAAEKSQTVGIRNS